MSDAQTLAVYARQVEDYVAMMNREAAHDTVIGPFLDSLPTGARVLDLGCGPGHFAGRMAAAGCTVDAWDAVPEMVALADRQPGVTGRLARFDDLAAVQRYDGIWAYFSLLHAPRAAFPDHLAAIARALKPGGKLVLGLKRGTGGSRDRLGRYYEYYEPAEIDSCLRRIGLEPMQHWTGVAPGLAGHPDGWCAVLARA